MDQLPTFENTRSSAHLAHLFGWHDQQLQSLEVRRGDTRVDVHKGRISGEPAAIFGTVVARNGYDPIDSTALYAYHAGTQWGMVADGLGLTIFNSQWVADSNWFQLPRIGWSEVKHHRDIFEAFTPQGLLDRQASRIATKQKEPSDFLKPVDDSLVERLDRWREQALRYARDADKVDELLQTFYAQLFVLRTVEDRGLDSHLEHASSAVVESDKFDRARWEILLHQARERIGSDLFNADVTANIPEHVLAGVILELYNPYKVPGPRPRYNFAWIDADVLGLAYEKYLASVLQPTSLPAQVDLFLPPERSVERYSVRKSTGAYYTPKYITEFLSTRCVDEYFNDSGRTTPPAVIDFACGSGSFLVAAIDKMLKHLKEKEPNRPWARELIEGGFIAGVDVDPKAVTAARLHLWQRLIEEPDALPLPNLSSVVLVADGLDSESWGALNRQYDIVLGNPPFLATGLVNSREKLEARFSTARGRYDFSSLFVEQGIRILAPGGHLGLVIPNRLFRNRSGGPVRRLISEQTSLINIVDFGSTKPFDADAYIGCIVAKKRPSGSDHPLRVHVIEVKSLEADFIASLLLSANDDLESRNSNLVRTFSARHPTGDGPWMLLSETEQLSRIMIEEVSIRLDTIAAIPQGIRTGGNDLFIVSLESADGNSLCKATNGLGESFIIESEILEPTVYGSQVKRYENIVTSARLLYPYRNNIPMSESELLQKFPRAWDYFSRNRNILGARASLKKSNGRFYELVWPRDETWLRRPKLLIRDLAPTTAFAIDPAGRVFLVGGTAVVPEDSELLFPLMAYLNSSVVNSLVKQTTPQFRGDFQKFEPQHIQGIPILDRLLQDTGLSEELGFLAETVVETEELSDARRDLEGRIDDLIRSAVQERGIGVSAN